MTAYSRENIAKISNFSKNNNNEKDIHVYLIVQ